MSFLLYFLFKVYLLSKENASLYMKEMNPFGNLTQKGILLEE